MGSRPSTGLLCMSVPVNITHNLFQFPRSSLCQWMQYRTSPVIGSGGKVNITCVSMRGGSGMYRGDVCAYIHHVRYYVRCIIAMYLTRDYSKMRTINADDITILQTNCQMVTACMLNPFSKYYILTWMCVCIEGIRYDTLRLR